MNVISLETTNESRCSCDRCDSAYCFSIRNADISCSCDPCPIEKDVNSIEESNSLQNMPANVIVNNFHEAVPKANVKTELDKYGKMETEQISRKQAIAAHNKADIEDDMSCVSIGRLIEEDSFITGLDNSTPKIIKSILDPLSSHLAAQIMNLPYTNSNERTYNKSLLQNIFLKYPNDIFKRIKDVYKACSCKVCECIAGKYMMKGSCDCKPCDCNRCRFTFAKEPNSKLCPVEDESCPCERCDRREQCKGINSDRKKDVQPRICDCNPSHKIKYGFSKPCDCKPCQCIECQVSLGFVRKTTLVVAPVEQNYTACDCSPCECAECVRSYRMSTETPTHRDMSTGIDRHPRCQCEACVAEACLPDGSDSCWCVRQNKIMSKPFQKNEDYDIRRAKFSCKFIQTDLKKGHHKIVAMFAGIPNKFSKKTKCVCGLCECIVCTATKNTESINVPEREIQNNRINHYSNGLSSSNIEKKYACDFRDCNNSESLNYDKGTQLNTCYPKSAHLSNINFSKEFRNSKHVNQQFVKNRENQDINCFKTVPHQPVCTYQSTVNTLNQRHSNANYSKDTFLNTLVANPTLAKHYGARNDGYISYYSDSNTQLQEADIERVSKVHSLTNKDEIRPGDENTTNDPSLHSFPSFIKDSGSITPISRNKKSGDSSLNSSGHDYANYLIHFPKISVEEYINDVMKTNFTSSFSPDINCNMNKLHISAKDGSRKSFLTVSTNTSFNPKHVDTSESSKKMYDTEETISKANVWHRGETIQNTRHKKDSRQELVDAQNDYYRHTKRAIMTPLTENYRKVYDTLKEAREFSQQLVKVLQKYKEANKQFDISSNKFKMSNFSINNEDLLKECNDTTTHGSYNSKNFITYMTVNHNKKTKVKDDKNRNTSLSIHQPSHNIPEREIWENVFTENKDIPTKIDKTFNDPFYNYKFDENVNSQTGDDVEVINEKYFLTDNDRTSRKAKYCNANTKSKEKQTDKKKKTKSYKYIYKRTITASNKMKIFPNYTNVKCDGSVVTEESSSKQDQTVIKKEIVHVSKSIIAINEARNVATTPNPTSYKSSEASVADDQAPHIAEIPKTDSTVTKKPHYQERELTVQSKQNVVPPLPALEMEIKDALRMFCSRPKDTLKVISSRVTLPYCTENEASVIQSEAKKLMESKVFQPYIGKISDTKQNEELNVEKVKSTLDHPDDKEKEQNTPNHSCSCHKKIKGDKNNDLQINYVVLRKISDHTVFVKWTAPEDLNKVKGYEILVDGRMIHKIHNASKCAAVVSCLPASPKILLTVRIVPSVSDVQSMLATTIVYRPKSIK